MTTFIDSSMISSATRYAVTPQRLWDGKAEQLQTGQAVIIHNQTIEKICLADQVPKTIPILNSGNEFLLMPGLIDAHVHYTSWAGPCFLAAGVTTVRDVGNDLDWILNQQAVTEKDFAAGPTILCCGYALDGAKAYWKYIGRSCQNPKDLRQAVRQQAERGVWGIKFYDGLSQEMMAAGAEEAHRHNLPVICDFGTDEPKAAAAVLAGINEIEHLTGCPSAWHESTEAQQDELIDLFLEHQVVLMPTLIIWDHLGRILDPVFKYDSRRKWVHPKYLELWDNYPSCQAVPEKRLRFQKPVFHQKMFLNRAFKKGITIGLGTDTPFPNIIPGFGVHDELAMYVDTGFSPIEALRAATSSNADILGLGSIVGQIKPGMQADMILVSGDPFTRISDIGNLELVIRKGMPLDREKLVHAACKAHHTILNDPITRDLLEYMQKI